jgi:hypothetical protein
MTGISGPTTPATQERSMNFTRLACLAAISSVLLASPAAHAQRDQSYRKAIKLIDDWALKLTQILDNSHSVDRDNQLRGRTKELGEALKALPCDRSENHPGIFAKHMFNAAKNLPVKLAYDPECKDDKVVNAEITIQEGNSLIVDDALYSQALATKDIITTGLSKWAAAERNMIDAASGSAGRTKKFNDILGGYKESVEGATCHPKVSLGDFKNLVTENTKSLPVHLTTANATCDKNNKWHIALEVYLDETAPGWPGTFSKWADISNTVLRKPSDLVTDQQKKDYKAKLASGGDFVRMINKVACSEEDAVVGALKKQGEPLKAAFSRFSPSFDHCKEGHVNLSSVDIELAKPDSKTSKPETKKTGTQK